MLIYKLFNIHTYTYIFGKTLTMFTHSITGCYVPNKCNYCFIYFYFLQMLVALICWLSLGLSLAATSERKSRDEGASNTGYPYNRGTPGGWETRNGVSSFGWDSRRPTSSGCIRCSGDPGLQPPVPDGPPQSPPPDYRGNGYDNLSPEWQIKEGKSWRGEWYIYLLILTFASSRKKSNNSKM